MTRARVHGDDTPLSNWIRLHPRLDSVQQGITVNDQDFIFHKYKNNVDGMGMRAVQLMQCVEGKMYGALPSVTQKQTLFFQHQLLNKRLMLFDSIGQKPIAVWHFGFFVLSVPGTYPGEVSNVVEWYRFSETGRLLPSVITVDQLVGVLSFKLNPVTLEKLSLRRHHKETKIVSTENAPLGFTTERIITRRS